MAASRPARRWFEAQLQPGAIPDPAADALQSWWPSIASDAPTIWNATGEAGRGWEAMANYQRWCLLRRIYSRRQVLEVMTEFFENHLHVPVHDDGVFGFRADYGRRIRSHALGRFDQMLRRRDHPPRDGRSASTTPARPRTRPTRTSAASCSSCTPSAGATTPRTTSRPPRAS